MCVQHAEQQAWLPRQTYLTLSKRAYKCPICCHSTYHISPMKWSVALSCATASRQWTTLFPRETEICGITGLNPWNDEKHKENKQYSREKKPTKSWANSGLRTTTHGWIPNKCDSFNSFWNALFCMPYILAPVGMHNEICVYCICVSAIPATEVIRRTNNA